tara:strand:+ start:278 stop:715 length:438 start_codon:yes stop_codon:yes gene_type:complete
MVRNENSYFRVLLLIVMSISLLTPHTVLAQTNTEEKKVDYYYEGQDAAERDYSGGGAMAGGFASGAILGIIGWGLGYIIIGGQDVDVPRRYTSDLESNQRRDFEDGYKDYVKKKRKSKFNTGGAVGTLFAIVLVVSAADAATTSY